MTSLSATKRNRVSKASTRLENKCNLRLSKVKVMIFKMLNWSVVISFYSKRWNLSIKRNIKRENKTVVKLLSYHDEF